MATHFHIEGIDPYNGDHEIDLSTLTNADLHTIKVMSGVRAGELEEALEQGDNDLVIAFAVIALERKGLRADKQALMQAEVGKITLVIEDEEEAEEQSPPAQPPTELGGEVSGSASNGDGDHQANGLSPTGSPPSATTASSGPQTSAN